MRLHKFGGLVKGMMSETNKSNIDAAVKRGEAKLSAYMNSSLLHTECRWNIEDAEETLESFNLTTMRMNGRLSNSYSNPPRVDKIKIPNTHRIDAGQGDEVMKLTISTKDYGKVLNKRCPRNQSRGANVTIVEDEQGDLMVIIFRDIIPANLLGQHKLAEEWFAKEDKTMYVNGCKATTHPNPYKIAEQLKDENAMNSAGLRSSNVKKVKNLSVTKPGTNTKFTYDNAKGKTITRTYTSAINRKAYNLSEMEEKPFGELIAFMDELYKNVATFWIQKFGCPENRINNEIEAAMKKMQVACCSIKQHKHQLGIHSDPSSRFPHCVFGKTINDWDDSTREWVRSCDGGKLILVDGCMPLDYGPSDVVFLNGNYLHGITNLKPKKGHKQVKGETLSRFSMQLYSDYQRNENKHGKYGTFSSKW